ncbi:MAG: hypothetical protein M0011_13520 [Elusimicrobia bacterium]|nr:hypothetical protein [Elusimicrobiota bacterium]
MKKLFLAVTVIAALAAAAAAARMQSNGDPARKLWKALDLMGKLEDIQIHTVNGASDTISVRSLSCVSEMYEACSLFVNVNGTEKLIVHQDAAGKIIDALYDHGIYPSEDDPSLSQSVKKVSCTNTNEKYECTLEEWR